MTIIISILVLGIVIFVHELGHFLTAKHFKMPVSGFSIGMGPVIYTYNTLYTEYALRAIPIGGHVDIEGMEFGNKDKDGFNGKPAYQRLIVLSAGVIMNFILAYVLLFSVVSIKGEAKFDNSTKIGHVVEQSLANGLLEKGDIIKEVDSHKVETWQELLKVLDEKKALTTDNKEIKVSLTRDGKDLNLIVPVSYNEKGNLYYGIVSNYEIVKLNFSDKISSSWKMYKAMFSEMFSAVSMLVTGKVNLDEVSGPIGIIKIVETASKQGLTSVMFLGALISINIGIMNLLPIPALDGGRIVFVILESLGIKVNKRFEENLHKVSLLILFGLIFIISIRDIFKIFK